MLENYPKINRGENNLCQKYDKVPGDMASATQSLENSCHRKKIKIEKSINVIIILSTVICLIE